MRKPPMITRLVSSRVFTGALLHKDIVVTCTIPQKFVFQVWSFPKFAVSMWLLPSMSHIPTGLINHFGDSAGKHHILIFVLQRVSSHGYKSIMMQHKCKKKKKKLINKLCCILVFTASIFEIFGILNI